MDTADKIIMWVRVTMFLSLIAAVCVAVSVSRDTNRRNDDYCLTNTTTVTAQWRYSQLTMDRCAWCGRTQNMNRHHAVPQSANPALRDVRENLVVLCRDCHFVLGHRCNWKQYNPDVLYICTHFTNCVKSADTRKELEEAAATPVQGRPDDVVTNGAPEL